MTTSQLMIEAADKLESTSWRQEYPGSFHYNCAICRGRLSHITGKLVHSDQCLVTRLRAASQQEMPERIRMLIELAMYRVKDATASKDDGARPDSFIDDKIAEQMAEIEAVYAKGSQP